MTENDVKLLIADAVKLCKSDEKKDIDAIYGRLWSLLVLGIVQLCAVIITLITILANQLSTAVQAAVK